MSWFKDIKDKILDSWLSNATFKTSEPEFVGSFPIRQDITVLPADDPKKLRMGWVMFQQVGTVVINDYAVPRVNMEIEGYPYIYPKLRGWRS